MRGYSSIGLFYPKTPENVGGILRAAHCFDVAMIAIEGKRFSKHSTDTYKQYKHMPIIETENLNLVIPYGCVPVAVELIEGAQSLAEYTHPERAFYIFGPEDGSLGKSTLEWCRDVIYIPTKGCLNLAACANVVLYDRMAKK